MPIIFRRVLQVVFMLLILKQIDVFGLVIIYYKNFKYLKDCIIESEPNPKIERFVFDECDFCTSNKIILALFIYLVFVFLYILLDTNSVEL